MLELHEPDGAFPALQEYLQGFWGRDELVPDSTSAGLSAVRRGATPAPPEPCALRSSLSY